MKKHLATLSAALLTVVAASLLSGCIVVRGRPAHRPPPARVIVVR